MLDHVRFAALSVLTLVLYLAIPSRGEMPQWSALCRKGVVDLQ